MGSNSYGNDWPLRKLETLGRVITGKTPPTRNKENFGVKYPFITPRDMQGSKCRKYMRNTERYLSEKGAYTIRSSRLPTESVVVSCIGSDMGKVTMTCTDSYTNQQLNSIVPNDDVVPSYLYYVLLMRRAQLKSLASGGTALPILKKSLFAQIEVPLPPLPEQRRIASILGPLDDKIELNHQMNHTLEEIAHATYKSWFVDFDPFRNGEFEYNEELGKEIPNGWRMKKLNEIAEVNQGKTPKAMDYADNGYKIIKHGDISNNGWIDWFRKEKGFVKNEIKESKLRRVLPGDILLSNSAHAERLVAVKRTVVHFIPDDYNAVYLTGELTFIRPISYVGTPYIHQFFISDKGENQIRYHQRGLHLTVGETRKISILVPPKEIIIEFNEVIKPLYQQIGNNIGEILTLERLRDALLPKLLSGEIRVNIDNMEVQE